MCPVTQKRCSATPRLDEDHTDSACESAGTSVLPPTAAQCAITKRPVVRSVTEDVVSMRGHVAHWIGPQLPVPHDKGASLVHW
jgi:hypothetical protein